MDISASCSADRLVLRLSGELDHHGAKTAARSIDGLIDEYLPRDTELDMSALTFMDSSGIALILKTERRMRETGGRCFVVNASSQPQRVIDASGIDRIISVKGASRV